MMSKLNNWVVFLMLLLCCSLQACAKNENQSQVTSKVQSQLNVRNTHEQPNVIIFFLDDAGYGDFAHHGSPTISTPNITALARGGVSFSQFYTSSPACSASRYSLLTGKVPGRSGFPKWVLGPASKHYLNPQELTLAEGFQAKGYATGMFGKWHLGNPNAANAMANQSLPLSHGFEQWLGTNVSHDYPNAKLMQGSVTALTPSKIHGNKSPITQHYRVLASDLPSQPNMVASLTGRYTKAAVDFIHKNKHTPFFAYIAHNMPHLGLDASASFKGQSKRGLLGDVMMEVDDSVAHVQAALKAAGVDKNTLIIFSSDNGPWLKFKQTKKHPMYGEARMHVGNAYPFRDGKGSTWEGGHRVPGIFYWPGTIDSGVINQSPVSTLDILPTLFSIIDYPLPENNLIDGRNISDYLITKPISISSSNATSSAHSAAPKELPFTLVYSHDDNQISAIRQGPWKLHIRIDSQLKDNYGFSASRQQPLLFQVEHDVGERYDLAAQYPERVKAMLAALARYQSSINNNANF
jgi:arylsulfatase